MNITLLTGKVERIEKKDDRSVIQIVSVTKSNDKTKYDTHNLIAYGRVASYAEANFKVGDVLFVQARLQSRKVFIEGEECRYETEIVIWTIYKIDGSTNC